MRLNFEQRTLLLQGADVHVTSLVIFYIYFALVLVEFVCQLFSDYTALRNWNSGGKCEIQRSEKTPLLGEVKNGPSFLLDKVFHNFFNVSISTL